MKKWSPIQPGPPPFLWWDPSRCESSPEGWWWKWWVGTWSSIGHAYKHDVDEAWLAHGKITRGLPPTWSGRPADPRSQRAIVDLMATKKICDGCGDEIKPWIQSDPAASDGLARTVRLSTGNNHQQWDLCDPCQGKIASALAELLPGIPREGWWSAIRPTKSAAPA